MCKWNLFPFLNVFSDSSLRSIYSFPWSVYIQIGAKVTVKQRLNNNNNNLMSKPAFSVVFWISKSVQANKTQHIVIMKTRSIFSIILLLFYYFSSTLCSGELCHCSWHNFKSSITDNSNDFFSRFAN